MKRIIILGTIYFLTLSTALLFAQEYTYQEKTDTKITHMVVQVQKDPKTQDETIKSNEENSTEILICDAKKNTKSWELTNQKNKIKIQAEVSGNIIKITGMIKGQPISKIVQKDNSPWFQSFGGSLMPFILSNQKEIEFWMINPDPNDLGFSEWTAQKKGTETITINNKPVEAEKVVISLKGFLSLFVHLDMWYRTKDGLFLKMIGAKGPPGTPITVMELIEEN